MDQDLLLLGWDKEYERLRLDAAQANIGVKNHAILDRIRDIIDKQS
jgi:hypothetical protein